MTRKRRKAARNPQPSSVWKSALIALPITVVVALLLLCLSALLLLATKDPVRHGTAVGVICLYLCGSVGGAICVRTCGKRFVLLSGLLVGGGLFVLCSLVALFFKGDQSRLAGLLLRAPVILTALGGAALARREKKRRRRR